MVPMVPYTVTASPFTPRRSASGAHGERSSHSPNRIPATRPGVPNVLCDVTLISCPATFLMISRIARPIASAVVGAPPRQPCLYGMFSLSRMGPLTKRQRHDGRRRRIEPEQLEVWIRHRFERRDDQRQRFRRRAGHHCIDRDFLYRAIRIHRRQRANHFIGITVVLREKGTQRVLPSAE